MIRESELSPQVQTLINKRRTQFLEHLTLKKRKSRVDVYMGFLKEFSGKQIYELEDSDVLDFLIFKDVNSSGRTVVRHRACPHIGSATLDNCHDKIRCSARHTANSMRIGIVQKLQKGFEELGRKNLKWYHNL